MLYCLYWGQSFVRNKICWVYVISVGYHALTIEYFFMDPWLRVEVQIMLKGVGVS